MKITKEEQEMVVLARLQKERHEEWLAQEKVRWDKEQKRMDTPGLGCLDCQKTEREVYNEGKYAKDGMHREESMGCIQILQWTGGGAMSEREYTVRFESKLCCGCMNKRIKGMKR